MRKLDYDEIIKLHNAGLTRAQIAERVGSTPGSISSTLSRLGLQHYTTGKGKSRDYEVVSDPEDLFMRGGIFSSSDIKASLKMKTWSPGMQFRILRTGAIVKVVNGEDKQ